MGKLLVTERRSFQRIYDLPERILPPDLDTRTPTPDELARFQARRLLGGLGLGTTDRVQWARWGRKPAPEQTILDMIDEGEVTAFEIEGLDGQDYCALTERLEHALRGRDNDISHLVHILSPFDNLVIRRGWLRTFFDFQYKLEAYTPKAKRKYGYFTLPILWGERMVARVDAKADRKPKTFIVRRLTFEPGFGDYEAFLPTFVAKLHAFAVFNGCERFAVEQTEPAHVRDPLAQALSLTE
jgi:uncharacterized protein YcaQ